MRFRYLVLVVFPLISFGFAAKAADLQKALFAGGCFWCVEKDFESVRGVTEAVSGFAGGKSKNPTYKKLGGHIETVEITFDADKVSYSELVHKFFRSVDPTDAGGQFCDRGKAYTTAVFALTPEQKRIATDAKKVAAAELGQKIVTPIHGASQFYAAEAYHQDYYKDKNIVLTRFGPKTKAEAYKKYRNACGRDQKVKALWGKGAAFL